MPAKGYKATHCKRGHLRTEENLYRGNSGNERGCKLCRKIRGREYYSENKEQARLSGIKFTFNLTERDLYEILEKQENRCAICKEEFSESNTFVVDHNHRCCPGKKSCGQCVRGLLCVKCNSGLGMFRDKPVIVFNALAYLVKE